MKVATDNLENVQDALEETIKSDSYSLRETLYSISPKDFQKAVELISKAKCVYIFGLSVKSVIARFLEFRLHRYKIRTKLIIHGGNEIFEGLLFLTQGDVLIIFDFHRIHQESLVALKFARDKGATTIVVTDDSISELASKADIVLRIHRESVKYLNSLAVPITLAHALSIGLAKYKKECISTLEEFDNIRAKYSPFWRQTKAP